MRSNTEIPTSVGAQPAGGEACVDGVVGSTRPGSVVGGGGAAQADVVIITFIWSRSSTQQLWVAPLTAGGQAFAGAGVHPAARRAVVYALAVSATGWVDATVRSLFRQADKHQRLPLVWSTGWALAQLGTFSRSIALKSGFPEAPDRIKAAGKTPISATTTENTAMIMARVVGKWTWLAYLTSRAPVASRPAGATRPAETAITAVSCDADGGAPGPKRAGTTVVAGIAEPVAGGIAATARPGMPGA